MAHVAGERNRKSRANDSKRVHESANVFLAIMKAQIGRIFSLVTDRIALRRRMTAQEKIDPTVMFQDLTKRETGDVAVVEIQERQTAALDDECAVVESMLIRIQREISAQTARSAVRQFNHVLESERAQARAHAIRGESRK